MKTVAHFHTSKKSPIEAARQGSVDLQSFDELGEIRLEPGQNFEQALEDIDGFSHLWVIYRFHLNDSDWKPKVSPPRGTEKKIGVFATRSPYRPNGLGLSCVELVERKGLSLFVRGFDLLDGTPIYDIKPYLAYSDSFPEAKMGWLENIDAEKFEVSFSDLAKKQIQFLEIQGLGHIKNILIQQLSFEPLNNQKKRVKPHSETSAVFAYKTWRAQIEIQDRSVVVQNLFSGYTTEELENSANPYGDKELHRAFKNCIF